MDGSVNHSANNSAPSHGHPVNEGTFNATEPGDGLLPDFTRQVVPDSLSTLSQYLPLLRNDFTAAVGEPGNSFQSGDSLGTGGQDSDAGAHAASGGLPTPASLADVILSTRQLLTHQTAESLSQLARQLEDQASLPDPSARMTTQRNARRTGVLLHHLGAMLLELARATMSLTMGQTPTEAVVNAGPAIYISTSRPSPFMVQPLPRTGARFGPSTGIGLHGSVLSGGSVGSSSLQSILEIRISTGPLTSSSTPMDSQREATTGIQQPLRQSNQPTAPAASGPPLSPLRVIRRVARRVGGIPRRTSLQARDAAGVPQSLGQSNQSTPDIGSFIHADAPAASGPPLSTRRVHGIPLGTFLQARVRRVSNAYFGNQGGPQSSERVRSGGLGSGQQLNSSSTASQDGTGLPLGDANGTVGDGAQNVQGFSGQFPSGFDQFFRSIFPGEPIHTSDVNLQGMGRSSATSNSSIHQATSQESGPVSGNGSFFSHLLHQVLPMISGNTTGGSARGAEDVTESRETQTFSAQGHENTDSETRSRRHGNQPSSPSSKRQRR